MQETTTPFDLLNAPLTGTNLIEAGAGTGKTYAITGIFLRLILESGLMPEEILVVTFTQAATHELKTRIRNTLVSARTTILHGTCGDRQVDALVHRLEDPNRALDQLTTALTDFDRAAIFTIHGFCHRILSENAYETGTPFEMELAADPSPFLNDVADDFWRKQFYHAPLEWLAYALTRLSGPEAFAQMFGRVHSAEIKIIPDAQNPDFSGLDEFRSLFNLLKARWPKDRDAIAGHLMDPALSGTYYGGFKPVALQPELTKRERKVDLLIAAMGRFFSPTGIGFPLIPELEMFTHRKIVSATRKHETPPHHDLFHLFEKLSLLGHALQGEMEQRLLFLKKRFIGEAHRKLAEIKKKRNILFYNDLLEKVDGTLHSPEGRFLSLAVENRYRAALVDEFQDTDSVQYRIFSTLFSGSNRAFFMIGDPKQAIYGFRGADLFTYLKAAQKADTRYTLTRNWRSAPGLIAAVNAIFSGCQSPFIHEGIQYLKAVPAKADDTDRSLSEAAIQPMVFWFLTSQNKPLSKTDAIKRIAPAVAGEVVRLISGKEARPRPPGDIAILVRTNRQAKLIQESLSQVKVPSVLHRTDNIFDSREAEQMQVLLRGLAHPADTGRFRAALSSDLMGVPADQLDITVDETGLVGKLSHRFDTYCKTWREAGIFKMFHRFMVREKVRPRLLAYPDGERRLTNILHLLELLHRTSVERDATPDGLISWLAEQRNQNFPRLAEEPLRLESDDGNVRIVTIHKCKGLEFPVVFCPFVWEGVALQGNEVMFHDPNERYRPVLDLGSPELDQHRRTALLELLTENIRLLYVALTRARERCFVAWGRINTADASALAYLLHGQNDVMADPLADLSPRFREMTDQDLLDDLNHLGQRAGNALVIRNLPAPVSDDADIVRLSSPKLKCRSFKGTIRAPWRISSYTSLLHQNQPGEGAPDRDVPPSPAAASADIGVVGKGKDIFSFPRGARAGTFFHDILEHLDFTRDDNAYRYGLVQQKLTEYGFDADWAAPVSRSLGHVLNTPLLANRPDFQLSSVDNGFRINEMEFYYPLKKITAESLNQALSTNAPDAGSHAFPDRMESLSFVPHEGFMKGYIDLVFQYSGRFYLVDWKSNYLGARPEDYREAALRKTMAAHYYLLQYHLYVVALDRYLNLRLRHYDYQTDFGGVFYIFLRGVDPGKGPGTGIYYDRPDPLLIDSLINMLIPGGNG